jgi:putative peptidoglycan lipid II flippase
LLVGVWPFRDDPNAAAFAAAVAVTASGVLQAIWVWLGARRAGAHGSIGAPRVTDGVKRLVSLAVPGAIAGGALQINVLVSQALASFEQGAITYLNVADRLYQLPLGLIGIAVGVAMLPRLSRLVHEGDEAGARGALDEAVALSMAFTLPAAAAIMAIPFFLIDGLYTRGAFTSDDAHSVALALFHYGWGVPAFVLAKIYAPAFFAREDTKAPMRYAITSMVVNIVLGAALFFVLRQAGVAGFPGLAIATSAAAWLNVLLMIRSLVARGAYGPTAPAYARLLRIGFASLVLFGLLWLAGENRDALEAQFGGKEGAILAVILVGGTFYFALAFLVRAVTFAEVRSAFRRERGAPNGGGGLPPGLDG